MRLEKNFQNILNSLGKFNYAKIFNMNMAVIFFENGSLLQSYRQSIAIKTEGDIYINERYYKYSKTTSTHLGKYLNMSSKEIEKSINMENIKLIKNE